MGVGGKEIFRLFKLNGLTIQSDAFKRVVDEMNLEPSLHAEDVIYAIKNSIDKSTIRSGVVTMDILEHAFETLLNVSTASNFQTIQFFDAFKSPVLKYVSAKNTYEVKAATPGLFASAEEKIDVFLHRYALIEQRIHRNALFCPPVVISNEPQDYFQLSKIESLMGSTGTKHLLAMIGQNERQVYYLEDPTGVIPINLEAAKWQKGFYTVNCLVLVSGHVQDDVLQVSEICFPPPESRADSLLALGDLDPMGVEMSRQQWDQIRRLEQEQGHEEDPQMGFVLLSDVHLDKPSVLARLDVLLRGFEPLVPRMFVLMGNFTSRPVGLGSSSYSMQHLTDGFDALATLVAKYPRICRKSQFLLLPGPADPTLAHVLPRHGLPSRCLGKLRQTLMKVHVGSNPCRFRYFSQDMLVLRDDLLTKLRRHSINPISTSGPEGPEDEEDVQSIDLSEYLAKTVIDQAHLCPLPLSVQPVYWQYDTVLQLFPLPNVIFLANRSKFFVQQYCNCIVINPGPFDVDYSFVVYDPATREAELSSIEDDMMEE